MIAARNRDGAGILLLLRALGEEIICRRCSATLMDFCALCEEAPGENCDGQRRIRGAAYAIASTGQLPPREPIAATARHREAAA